jgi:hypothetical protein
MKSSIVVFGRESKNWIKAKNSKNSEKQQNNKMYNQMKYMNIEQEVW